MEPGCLWIRVYCLQYYSPFSASLKVLNQTVTTVTEWVTHVDLTSCLCQLHWQL